ncbi:uncharacterized protein LOC113338482 [Papaver somniferum]|uniref:uncharacterized protein LOC113338482 n=1 Tax=Papaver somniferum TaxID=3469 RepID=UPI000E6FBAF7|nr:uncharacterized protein LOC113338482 [Papaver somniferum]
MAFISWHLWKDRCSFVFNNKHSTPHTTNSFLTDAESVCRPSNHIVVVTTVHRWSPPTRHLIKVNTNAYYCHVFKNGGYGLIFRNSTGTHLAFACANFREASGPELLESLAAMEAVKLASQLGFKKIVIEADYV